MQHSLVMHNSHCHSLGVSVTGCSTLSLSASATEGWTSVSDLSPSLSESARMLLLICFCNTFYLITIQKLNGKKIMLLQKLLLLLHMLEWHLKLTKIPFLISRLSTPS